jgi:magnesium transporter
MVVGTWYGMNFEEIHEFKWKYGYLMAVTITLAATGITIWWFKKRGWF